MSDKQAAEIRAKLIMAEVMTAECKKAIEIRDANVKGSKERAMVSSMIDVMLEMTQTIMNYKPSKEDPQ